MPSPRTKPSLVACVMLVLPLVYVLSYAPVVRVCGRTAEVETLPTSVVYSGGVGVVRIWPISRPMADSSLYPTYKPIDWLIDNTPLRKPLFFWAQLWNVRVEFEQGAEHRASDPHL